MSLFSSDKLKGKRVAIVATDGFEQLELTEPQKYLKHAGAEVDVISLKAGTIRGWDKTDWGDKADVDKVIDDVHMGQYDALVLPGGQINPDKLRLEPKVVNFVRDFMQSGKVVAAICHGPWTLIEADQVRGRHLTSWPSLKTDLRNAGAEWQDSEVVVDGNLITSRKPEDLDAFNKKIEEKLLG